MRPVIIDRSLVGAGFNAISPDSNREPFLGCELTDKKAMFSYVCALAQAGVSYVELDFASLVRLPKPSGSENYIYRLGSPEEFVVANALNFAYVVLPLKFAYILPRIDPRLPVILEIDVGDVSNPQNLFNILGLISSEMDLTHFAMIRLTGEFDPDTLPVIFNNYKRRTIIPLDICPRNTVLTALDTAITAYRHGFDSITVSFGDDNNYASLEELLIMLASMYKIIISPDYLEGICRAVLFSGLFDEFRSFKTLDSIGEFAQTNLSAMMSRYSLSAPAIPRVDDEPTPCPECGKVHIEPRVHIPRVRIKANENQNGSFSYKALNSMGLDGDILNEIAKILESCNLDIKGKAQTNEDN